MNANQSRQPVYPILFTISFAHFINDILQAVIPAIYPLLKLNYQLSFVQVGLITLTYQLSASLLQPLVGIYTDRNPKPYSLVLGMFLSLIGVIALSQVSVYAGFLIAVTFVGLGSSIFHPESSRVANLASGGQRGLAQSIFQIGGNSGSALGPLMVALVVIPNGQRYILWFSIFAILGIFALYKTSQWYKIHLVDRLQKSDTSFESAYANVSSKQVFGAIAVLVCLIFSKYFYLASMTNYFTFYLIEKFSITIQESQYYLFAFLAAIALGTYIGGPLGDRFGRRVIIWVSILGAAPFTLLLPYVDLFWVVVLAIIIGIIIASAFSAILVYAQELMPGKIGMISGLFFGLAFGLGGIGSALLGKLADVQGLDYMFTVCSYLPLLGVLTWLLPKAG